MKHPGQQGHPIQVLAPKQQTLNFGGASLWQQLTSTDRRACRDAIAALLCQVVDATYTKQLQLHKEHDEHE